MDQRCPNNTHKPAWATRKDTVLNEIKTENHIDEFDQPQERSKGHCEDKRTTQMLGVVVSIG